MSTSQPQASKQKQLLTLAEIAPVDEKSMKTNGRTNNPNQNQGS